MFDSPPVVGRVEDRIRYLRHYGDHTTADMLATYVAWANNLHAALLHVRSVMAEYEQMREVNHV